MIKMLFWLLVVVTLVAKSTSEYYFGQKTEDLKEDLKDNGFGIGQHLKQSNINIKNLIQNKFIGKVGQVGTYVSNNKDTVNDDTKYLADSTFGFVRGKSNGDVIDLVNGIRIPQNLVKGQLRRLSDHMSDSDFSTGTSQGRYIYQGPRNSGNHKLRHDYATENGLLRILAKGRSTTSGYHDYDTSKDEDFDVTHNEDFDSSDDEDYDVSDDEDYDGSDDEYYDGSDDEYYDGSDDEYYDGSDDEDYDGSDDEDYDGSDDEDYDGSDDEDYDGSDDEDYDGSDDEDYDVSDDEYYAGSDDEDYDGSDDEDYDGSDDEDYDGYDDEDYDGSDDGDYDVSAFDDTYVPPPWKNFPDIIDSRIPHTGNGDIVEALGPSKDVVSGDRLELVNSIARYLAKRISRQLQNRQDDSHKGHFLTSDNDLFGALYNDRTHTSVNDLFDALYNDRTHISVNDVLRALDKDRTHISVNDRTSINGRLDASHNDQSRTSVNGRFGASDQGQIFNSGGYIVVPNFPQSISGNTNPRDLIHGRPIDPSNSNLHKTDIHDFPTSENTNDIDSDNDLLHPTGNGHFGVSENGDFRVSEDGVFSISGDGEFRHSGNGYFRDSGEGSNRHLGNGDYSVSSKGDVFISGTGNVYNEKETEKDGKLKLIQLINLILLQPPQSANTQPPKSTPEPNATQETSVISSTALSTTTTTRTTTPTTTGTTPTTEEVTTAPPTTAKPNVTPTILVDQFTETEEATSSEMAPVASYCSTTNKADIILVIDASSSVGTANWVHQTAMAANITHYFDVDSDDVRFAAILFNQSPTKLFDLKDYTSHSLLEYNLKRVPYPRQSGTYTHEALKYIMTQDMFGPASGGRDDAPNIVIVMTDGKSKNITRTLEEARKLKASGITTITVGIGTHLSQDELIGIASTPDDVIMADSYEALGDSLRSLVEMTCQAAGHVTKN